MELDRDMIASLLGNKVFAVYCELEAYIQETYDTQILVYSGKKNYQYEIKFRKASKTLCACYLQEHKFGFMVILGAKERDAFEKEVSSFTEDIVTLYTQTKTYHDGKWLWIEILDDHFLADCKRLLTIKRRPTRK